MTTGEKITEERKKLGLTQQQFADELGVTRQAVSRWESDLAFPETDTLIKMSKAFGCSIDYLLKYDSEKTENGRTQDEGGAQKYEEDRTDGQRQNGRRTFGFDLTKWHYEYKSEKTVMGMPLVHVNIGLGRVAKGFFSVGLISSGIFSVGLLSAGVVSLGILSLGLIALGILCLGGVSLGSIALGLIALGGVALGVIALGGVSVGCFSLGGCAIGLFSVGGYSNGRYVAVGDYAVGQIAFGKTTVIGGSLSVSPQTFTEQKEEAWRLMDKLPPFWGGFVRLCKEYAQKMMVLQQ